MRAFAHMSVVGDALSTYWRSQNASISVISFSAGASNGSPAPSLGEGSDAGTKAMMSSMRPTQSAGALNLASTRMPADIALSDPASTK